MRKFSFLFAFLLFVMGVTQAWAFSITGPEILNSSDWSKESGRWNEWSDGIYDYAGGNYLSDTEIVSPLLTHTSSNGVKITINGNNNGGSTSVLKVYYSTDKTNWTSTTVSANSLIPIQAHTKVYFKHTSISMFNSRIS